MLRYLDYNRLATGVPLLWGPLNTFPTWPTRLPCRISDRARFWDAFRYFFGDLAHNVAHKSNPSNILVLPSPFFQGSFFLKRTMAGKNGESTLRNILWPLWQLIWRQLPRPNSIRPKNKSTSHTLALGHFSASFLYALAISLSAALRSTPKTWRRKERRKKTKNAEPRLARSAARCVSCCCARYPSTN